MEKHQLKIRALELAIQSAGSKDQEYSIVSAARGYYGFMVEGDEIPENKLPLAPKEETDYSPF